MNTDAKNRQNLLEVSSSGAQAASLLYNACRIDLESSNSPQLGVVRELAGDLENQLKALAHTKPEGGVPHDLLAEAAVRCADLANLAACNLQELSETSAPLAAASVHLAAGTVRALGLIVESSATNLDDLEGAYLKNIHRDVRGARWRTDLAVRQADEFMPGGS